MIIEWNVRYHVAVDTRVKIVHKVLVCGVVVSKCVLNQMHMLLSFLLLSAWNGLHKWLNAEVLLHVFCIFIFNVYSTKYFIYLHWFYENHLFRQWWKYSALVVYFLYFLPMTSSALLSNLLSRKKNIYII